MKDKCRCGEPATTAGLCHNHYNIMRYWFGKSGKCIGRAVKHVEKLKIRAEILDSAFGAAVPTNIVDLTKHPRFAPKRATTRSRRRRAG